MTLTATVDATTASIKLLVDFASTASPGTVNRIGNASNEAGALLSAGASSAVTQSATQARTGTNSSRLTRSTGSGTAIGQTPSGTSGFPVSGGETVTGSGYVRSTTSRTATLGIAFFTLAGASVGSTTTGTGVATSTSAFTTRLTVTATAPATARYAQLILTVPSVASTSEFHYADDFQLEAGSTATAFAYGGQADADFIGAADASMSVRPPYNRVTVTRADGTVVRGLDNALAPGGMTRGVDHEAPLGVAQTYTAVVSNGLASLTPSTATATLAAQTGTIWIKSLLNPALSVQVTPQKYPQWTRGIPQSILPQLGDEFPSVNEGTRQAGSGTLTALTTTAVQRAALDALLEAGGPYLIQFTAQSGEPDVYARIGAFEWQRVSAFSGEPYRVASMPLTAVKRPSTGGSAVAIPGSTFQDSLSTYATFSAATAATFGSP